VTERNHENLEWSRCQDYNREPSELEILIVIATPQHEINC